MEEEPCGVCGMGISAHSSMRHEYSTSGQLMPKPPSVPAPRSIPTIDIVLRQALLTGGLITAEDLHEAEVAIQNAKVTSTPARSSVSRDSSTGPPALPN